MIYQPVYEVKGLAGAVYEITAAEDIITPDGTLRYAKGEVVDTVTTDENGLAKSKELYLGRYTVVEITAPEGMVINKEAHEVELTYAGQEVAVTETATSFVNERQKVTVSLEKAIEKNDIFNIGNGDEVKNISFGLFAGEELVSASGTSIPADGLIEIISLSENGKAVIKTDLPFGSYYVKELATDEHYILSDSKYPFTFSYAGQDTETVEIAVNEGKPIENKLIYGSVSGKKITENGEALGGAVIGLFKADETEFTKENALYLELVRNSVSYMVMARLGLDADKVYSPDDFAGISNFNSQEVLNAVGIATSDIAEMALLKDENAEVLLPHFSCHSLRHTFTTRMCEAGVNVKVIQDTLGHKDISTTLNIYTDVTKELRKSEFEGLDSYFKNEYNKVSV